MISHRALPYQASPVAAFAGLQGRAWPVLLDSQDAGRWDVLSADPLATAWQSPARQWHGSGIALSDATADGTPPDAFAMLQAMQQLKQITPAAGLPALPFHGGVLGCIGYAADSEHGLPARRHDDWPLATLAYYEWALCTDHAQRASWLVWQDDMAPEHLARVQAWADALSRTSVAGAATDTPTTGTDHAARTTARDRFGIVEPFRALTGRERYARDIGHIHDLIRAGDCYQVNYTQAWEARHSGRVWSVYPALRAAARAPYACYWGLPWGELISLSPEQFLAAERQPDGHQRITTKPIKGTRRRAEDPVRDAAEAAALLASAKDRAENIMITDLLRNDLGKHALTGSVRVTGLCALESFGQVHHLVSTIVADLPAQSPLSDMLRDAFPGGSITGAPKKRTMEIIETLEPTPRGIYCGSVVLWDALGRLDSSITIRTLVSRDGVLRTWAGGGITLDSRWEDELQECWSKMGGLMALLEDFQAG